MKSVFVNTVGCFLIVLFSLVVVAVPSAADDTIKVGALFPLSSWAAVAGKPELAGIQLAVEDINRAGGINGKKIELITEDNKSSFRETATAYQKLAVVDNVKFVLGPSWAEFSEIVAPLADRYKVITITPSGYVDGLVVGKKYMFTLFPSTAIQTEPFAKLVAAKKHKKIALVHSENAYFNAITSATEIHLKQMGSAVSQVYNIQPEDQDFRSLIIRVKNNGSDAVIAFLLENGQNAGFLKQAKELGLAVQIYASPGLPLDPVIKKSPTIANGVQFFNFSVKASSDFSSRFAKRFPDTEPIFTNAQAYDSVFVLKNAIEQCGEDSAKVLECMHKTDLAGMSGRIRFDADGNIIPSGQITSVYEVRDGKFVELEGFER